MHNIIYYVASSLDGFICGPKQDISLFQPSGSGVERYLADLQTFNTVIMGRKTYEFGYEYGLVPGQPAYPHMEHHIFSSSLTFKKQSSQVHVHPLDIKVIDQLIANADSDIYLCGGGEFAGWLLDHGRINLLKIKLNPIILGEGIALFGKSTKAIKMELLDQKVYEGGLQIVTYQL